MFSMFNKRTDDKNQTESNPRNQFVSPRRKPFSEIIYEQKVAKLPLNFAQNVLDLQMQLEFVQTYNMDIIVKLNELYRIAIEHYINQDIKKANHFQRKLTTLLTNPQTVELMDRKALQEKQQINRSNKVSSFKSPSKSISGIQYTTSLRKEINQFNNQSDILVKSMIQGVQRKGQRNHRFIQNHIVSQQEQLKKRLEMRSRSRKVQ